MADFDPAEPAVLHEQRQDRMVPWTGDHSEDWRQRAERHAEGVIAYRGLLFDGWGHPLGG
jgi:hypothetical protein